MKTSSVSQPNIPEKEFKKTIRTFAWASFLNDMGSDMIYPVWPLFLSTVLNANMAVIGLIDGLSDAIVSLSKAVAGYYSDKLGKRKIFIWTGYFFGSLSRLGYAISLTWQMIIPFRILDRAGKIRSAPRDAMVADISAKNKRGGYFGLLRAMDNLGAVVGILLCIFLVEMIGYRNLFLLAAIPSVIGAILILVYIKEKKVEGTRVFKGISFKDVDNNFRLFLFLSAIFALGAFSYSFLMIFAKENGFKLGFIPVLYLIFTATAFLFSYPFGRLADKWGRKTMMIISFLLWALVCFACILQLGKPGIFACFVLFGMHKAALEPVQKAFVSELAPRQFRASSLGGYQMVIGIFALPSSFLAGLLWENIGILAPFYFSLSLSAIAVFLLIFVKENQHID